MFLHGLHHSNDQQQCLKCFLPYLDSAAYIYGLAAALRDLVHIGH